MCMHHNCQVNCDVITSFAQSLVVSSSENYQNNYSNHIAIINIIRLPVYGNFVHVSSPCPLLNSTSTQDCEGSQKKDTIWYFNNTTIQICWWLKLGTPNIVHSYEIALEEDSILNNFSLRKRIRLAIEIMLIILPYAKSVHCHCMKRFYNQIWYAVANLKQSHHLFAIAVWFEIDRIKRKPQILNVSQSKDTSESHVEIKHCILSKGIPNIKIRHFTMVLSR